MGAWGYRLFQSDADLDVTDQISEEAGKLAHDPDFTFWYPTNQTHVVDTLNAGLFHQLLDKFRAKNWKSGVIYLGALSMQLGAKIPEEDMQVLKETLDEVQMYDEAEHQMRTALRGYKNDGVEWNFESPGLLETAENKKTGGWGLNVMQDFSKMPTQMPREGEVETDDVNKKGGAAGEEKAKEATGKDTLSDKVKLKAWFSL